MSVARQWFSGEEASPGVAERRAGPLLLPMVLVASVVGVLLVAAGAIVHTERESALSEQRTDLSRDMDVLELMLSQRARDLGAAVTEVADDDRLGAAVLSGEPDALERYVRTLVRGGVLEQLTIMTPGMPIVSHGQLAGGNGVACDRSHVAGTLVAAHGARGTMLVATRDRITDAGIPLRVCGSVDLASSAFIDEVARLTEGEVAVSAVAGAVAATPEGFSRTAIDGRARLRLVRRMRIAGDQLALSVRHRDGAPAAMASLMSPGSPLWTALIAAFALLACWLWFARRAERGNLVGLSESVTDGVLILDETQRVLEVNSTACDLLGAGRDDLIGCWLADVIDVREAASDRALLGDVMRCLKGSAQPQSFECVLVRPGRAPRALRITVRWMGGSGKGLIVLDDVSDEREEAKRGARSQLRDSLTGVLTDLGFGARVQQAVEICDSDGEVCSVLRIELCSSAFASASRDAGGGQRLSFELINVMYAGLRTSDLLAQLDAERFAVLLPGCGVDDALAVAESLRSKLRQYRYVDDGRMHQIAVSIGVVQVGNGLHDVDAIVRAASFACELARNEGNDRIRVYQMPGRNTVDRVPDREWAERIRHALAEDRFELFAQPLEPVDASGDHSQLEVLLRMRTDDGTFISPAAFLPVAERQSLAEQLDARVIEMLFDRFGALLAPTPARDQQGRALSLTVNVSAASVASARFADDLEERLRDYSVPRGRLGVEITETTAVSDMDAARRFFARMRGIGCPVILDDFGNSASSLGRLRALPADYVKLDALLLRDVVSDAVDRAMVRALCEVAASLDVQVVAHYVQNRSVLQVMHDLGVDYMQGFAVCPPRPLTDWLHPEQTERSAPRRLVAPLSLIRGGREH